MTHQDSVEKENRIRRAFLDIATLKNNIRSGDLVTRTGNDFTSQSLRSLNRRNKTYSHCGIASIENDSLFIYHAIGGEWNPDEKLRRDPWILFAEPYSNNGVGQFRFTLADSTMSDLLKIVKTFYTDQLRFDMDFDLASDDRMYCAEFIYKSFLKAGKGQLRFNRSYINGFEFIGVDDIFLHPICKKLAEIRYK
jgi:uncharacterized protein YnzC (UPF0291/DUF896 family)